MFIGDYHTALVENQQAMALDPYLEGTCYNNSGFACAMAGRADAALDFYRKSKEIRPSYLTTDSYMARAYWMKGELDSAEAVFQSIFNNPRNTMKERTYAYLVSFHYFKGRLQKAAEEAVAGIRFCREANHPGEEAYFHYLLGEIRREQARTDESIREMEEALRLCVSPFFEFAFVGMSYAKMGLESKALDIIAKIQSLESDDPFFTKRRSSFENFILGAVAREEQAYEEAIECFNQVRKFHSGDPIYWMAQKEIAFCTAMLREDEALAKYRTILDHAGEVFTLFLPASRAGGLWRGRLWTESLFELGKLYAARQDTTEAVEYLKKAMRSWEGADRDHRKANETQAVLAALHTVR
jgi:tetratricopeptide (TPR) repeat protein